MFTKVLYRKSPLHSPGSILVMTGILACLTLLVSTTSQAQSCCPNGIVFYSQTAIDNFQANYPGCTEIEGHVVITDNSTIKITNLNGLSVLTSIGEGLFVGDIDALTSLTGLHNLESIGGYLEIFLFDSLSDITALDKLEAIGGGLYIDGNRVLTNLSGLNNITHIAGTMKIAGNDRLKDLSALSAVTAIEGDVEIYNNDSLLSLSGLEKVTTIGGYLFVFNNDLLCSLTGLDSIDAESIQGLEINGNNWLSGCEVLSICNYLNNPSGNTLIVGNTVGCNSIEEVLDSCNANAVSVEEHYMMTGLSVYPNPTSSEITISGIEGIIDEISIYNKLGQRVIYEMKPDNTINVSRLPQGLYIVEVRWNEHRVREKLIVQ